MSGPGELSQIHLHLEQIVHLLTTYKYFILFPLSVVEGPVLAVIAGWLCTTGYLEPLACYPVIVAGDVIGDSLCYLLGRWGTSPRVNGLRRLLGIHERKIVQVRAYFDSHPFRTISLSKIALGIGVAGIFMAGNAKIPYGKFLGICLVTSAVQYVFYLGIGLLFGAAYVQIDHYLNAIASACIVAAIASVVFLIIKSLIKKI